MTNVIVVDASVLVPALVDDAEDGVLARRRLRGETLAAPELVDVEVVSVVRRLVAAGSTTERRAEQAMADLIDLPLERARHTGLVTRAWELRHDLTAYDAAYVALAEALGATLVTADGKLAAAPGAGCDVEVLRLPG